jgi:hypothetical protein
VNPREQLIAYLATLAALVVVLLGAMIIAALSNSIIGKMEAFGLGTVTGGLIGLMRLPSARPIEPAGTPSDPVSTKEAQ